MPVDQACDTKHCNEPARLRLRAHVYVGPGRYVPLQRLFCDKCCKLATAWLVQVLRDVPDYRQEDDSNE